MNKIQTLLTLVLVPSVGLSLAFIPFSGVATSIDPNDEVDCSRYFNDSSYTSLAEIAQSVTSNVSSSYKTWGTISDIHTLNDGSSRAFLQSTNQSGEKGAIAINNLPSNYEIGNVLTIEGEVSRNYGLLTMDVVTHNLDYYVNSSPIVPYELTSFDFGSGTYETEDAYFTMYEHGPIYSVAYNLKYEQGPVDFDEREQILNFPSGESVTLYLNSMDNSSIVEKLNSSYGAPIDIHAPMQAYESRSGYEFLEFLISSPEQIVIGEERIETVKDIEISSSNIEMELNESVTLIANVLPQNAANITFDVERLEGNLVSSYSIDNNRHMIVITSFSAEGSDIYRVKANGNENVYVDIQVNVSTSGGGGGTGNVETLMLDSYNAPYIGKYDTGNYGGETYNYLDFGFYRAVNLSGGFMTLLSQYENIWLNPPLTMPGAFYNEEAMSNMTSITISYRTNSEAYIRYGEDRHMNNTLTLNPSSSYRSSVFNLDGSNNFFFSVETGQSKLDIQYISIDYEDGYGPYTAYENLSGQYRLSPTVYKRPSLVAGETSISVPIDVTYDGLGGYSVNERKELVCDTLQDAYNSGRDDMYAYTDPVEVAAYFIAFGSYPCNYYMDGDGSLAKRVMGDKARLAQQFSLTDGYATAVPYRLDAYGDLVYYELDIALDAAYDAEGPRGVGRLVCWTSGFTCYDDTYPVVVYTDDHYATFKEYYNDGTFGPNFNAEMKLTPYKYGAATTIEL